MSEDKKEAMIRCLTCIGLEKKQPKNKGVPHEIQYTNRRHFYP